MWSQQSVEIVRRAYDAINAADLKSLAQSFAENSAWHTPGKSTVAGDFVGREAVFAQLGRYGEETGGTFKATLLKLFRADYCHVVGLHQNTAERNGKRLDTMCCTVFEVKDGKIVDGREHIYDLHNWEAFWA